MCYWYIPLFFSFDRAERLPDQYTNHRVHNGLQTAIYRYTLKVAPPCQMKERL